jgi:Cytochrome C oxidase, cbb3-type, subunit III
VKLIGAVDWNDWFGPGTANPARTGRETVMGRGIGIGIGMLVVSAIMLGQTRNETATAENAEPFSGQQLYTSYCALCHGNDGKGGGPFSPQLKVWPPDLTQLSKKNHGVFPQMHVQAAIDGEYGKLAHGTAEMPIWGPVFRSMARGHKDSAQVRIETLVKYLESIQER